MMPTPPPLSCHTLWQIDADTYIASAIFEAHTTPSTLKHTQSLAVRALLAWCLATIPALSTLTLDERTFPYQLRTPTNLRAYDVCFSHSRHQVALIISAHPCAIDIELRPISMTVARRFFHQHEVSHLTTLPTHQQALLCCQLWCLKECFIKLHHLTLTLGMSQDYAAFLPLLTTHHPQTLTALTPSIFLWTHDKMLALIEKPSPPLDKTI